MRPKPLTQEQLQRMASNRKDAQEKKLQRVQEHKEREEKAANRREQRLAKQRR